MPKLKMLNGKTLIYARPKGSHFHLDRNCTMLQGLGGFEKQGYVSITIKAITKRKLRPCVCAYEFLGSFSSYKQSSSSKKSSS